MLKISAMRLVGIALLAWLIYQLYMIGYLGENPFR